MNQHHSDQSTLSAVLSRLMKKHKVSCAKVGRAVGLPRNTISRLESGAIKDPKSSNLAAIASFFNISMNQLFGLEPIKKNETTTSAIMRIPIIPLSESPKFKKETLKLSDLNHSGWSSLEWEEGVDPKKLFAFAVTGDAMLPIFHEDHLVIIDSEKLPHNRSYAVVYIAKTKEVVFRQLLIDNKSQILKPLNSIFAAYTLTPNDLIIGTAIHLRCKL